MFVHPSYTQLFVETDKVEENIFADLKDYICFDDAIHDMEEDVNEIFPETQHESQTQSLGHLGHSLWSNCWQEETRLQLRRIRLSHQ